MPAHPPALLLMGPTASGKTKLAIELVERAPFDIISVDSGMVYRGMDIGTAKPNAAMLERAPHRLIDIRDPADAYSAADFRRDALREMAAISAAGRVPVLVGGTMLYFKLLLDGVADMPPGDAAVRAKLTREAEIYGWPTLHARLAEVDAPTAARLSPNDGQRLQRALEVFELTGKPLSQWHSEQAPAEKLPYQFIQVAVAPPERAQLHERIALRFDEMLAQGFEQEVQALRARDDLHADLPAMRAVGYAQMWAYLQGDYNAAEMRLRGIYATRQLAKRQYTWLRRFEQATWFDGSQDGVATQVLQRFFPAL